MSYSASGYRLSPQTLSFGASDTSKSFQITPDDVRRGYISMFVVDVANFTNSVTAALSVTNGRGRAIPPSVSGIPKGAVTTVACMVPISDETLTVTVTLSGAPGGSGGNVVVETYLY